MTKQITFTLFLFAWCIPVAHADAEIPSMVVFQNGVDGYHTYRIPAIVRTSSGVLLAFCEGRKSNDHDAGDIDLLMKTSRDDGQSWSSQVVIHEEGDEQSITIGNPCPVVDTESGNILLLFTRNNARAFQIESQDDGKTWSSPREISASFQDFPFPWKRLGIGPVNGIQTKTGRLVIPVWLNDKIGENYRSASVYSDDHGATWKAGGIVSPDLVNANECAIAELSSGKLYMSLRTKDSRKRRGVSFSEDGGETWSSPQIVDALIDPICQGGLLQLNQSDTLAFSNPASTKRANMTLRFSHDQGRSWKRSQVLWSRAAAYSCLVELPENRIGCLFEAGESGPYESIRFAVLGVPK